MKYEVRVSVEISQKDSYHPLRLEESSQVELDSLSDAAMILVKLHEFFQALKVRK